jgi:phosphoglycerol transferase MdoB-like AlkP superfamily enzyme
LPGSVRKSLQYYIDYNQQAFANVTHATSRLKVYTFSHFLLPHEPYVYRRETLDSLTEADIMDHKNGYIKQVIYANQLIEKLVKELKKDPHNIIIIQGDHGFRNYESSTSSLQLETYNAFYFPDKNYSLLYDSISLVNTYRVLLRQYYHQNIPLLSDRYFLPAK